MSLKKVSKNQPDTFEFDSKNLEEAEKIINSDEITDKEKYLAYYKIETLKNISQ